MIEQLSKEQILLKATRAGVNLKAVWDNEFETTDQPTYDFHLTNEGSSIVVDVFYSNISDANEAHNESLDFSDWDEAFTAIKSYSDIEE